MTIEPTVSTEPAISVAQCDDGASWYGIRRGTDGNIVQVALACSRKKVEDLLNGTRKPKKAYSRFRK